MLLLFGGCLHSIAQTGVFNTNTVLNGENRTLSCYVPGNYNPALKYRLLIGLHGMGDNSTNYRNALINSLGWHNLFSNTIMVCPDGGEDTNSDFYTPKGDEQVIDAAIKWVCETYSIDTTKIILQGFSLGGRSALKYGLDHTTRFCGLLLNTPALQGTGDLNNKPEASLVYAYEKSSTLPICVTVGDADYLYVNTLEKLAVKLKDHEAKVSFTKVSGMGHSIPNSSYTGRCIGFLDNPTSGGASVDLYDKKMQSYFCEPSIKGVCSFQNTGDSVVQSVQLTITAGSTTKTQVWSGHLSSFQRAEIPFNIAVGNGGNYLVAFKIDQINGTSVHDSAMLGLSQWVEVAGSQSQPYYFEGFETPGNTWKTNEPGSLFEWFKDNSVKRTGDSSMAAFNTILIFNTKGERQSFSSPIIDMSALKHKTISFDYAYNYHKYTPPYVTAEMVFADTLEVAVSTDCGETFQPIFYSGGSALATSSSPILNPLNISQCFFTPKADEWQKRTLDLSSYANAKDAIIRFSYISGMGGSIYVDNISVGRVGMFNQDVKKENTFAVYPNPAKDMVKVSGLTEEHSTIHIYDQSGKKVLTRILEKEATINIEMLSSGMYTLEATDNNGSSFQKLIITK